MNETKVTKRSERCVSEINEEINQGLKCENLSEEINLRIESLERKYDQNWDILGDYQILEISLDI